MSQDKPVLSRRIQEIADMHHERGTDGHNLLVGQLRQLAADASNGGDPKSALSHPAPSPADGLAGELERLHKVATEAPWAWDQRGEKVNEWGLGIAMRADETLIAGHFKDENIEYVEYVCSHEAATCNYKDPELICTLRNNLPQIIAALRSRQAQGRDAVMSAQGYGSKIHVGRFLNTRFTIIVDPDVPDDEIHIKDPTGRLLGKIINVGYD